MRILVKPADIEVLAKLLASDRGCTRIPVAEWRASATLFSRQHCMFWLRPWYSNLRLAFAFAGALSAANPADAQSTAAVTGVVADATGAPLVGATITLRGLVERTGRTDSAGRFDIPDLPHGDYTLTATAAGFAPAHRRIRVPSSESTSITLTLAVLLRTHRGHRDKAVSVTSDAPLAVERATGLNCCVRTFTRSSIWPGWPPR